MLLRFLTATLLLLPVFVFAERQLGSQCQIDPRIDGGPAMTEQDPLSIQYMGNDSVRYSGAVARPFDMIVFHDPGSNNCDPFPMIRYGQTYDASRGGVFGYHFYIARDGKIYQGAPMNRRTNHISSANARTNMPFSNSSALGISLMCGHQQIPEAQLRAAQKLGHAIQVAYGVPSNRIFGHGELQTNRSPNEGLVAARLTRQSTPSEKSQIKYAMNGAQVLCGISGRVPPGCTGNGCEVFAQSTGVLGGQQHGPAPFDTPMQGNTGYQLPQGGQAPAGSPPSLAQGQGRPTGVASGGPMQTDAQAWGYNDLEKKEKEKLKLDQKKTNKDTKKQSFELTDKSTEKHFDSDEEPVQDIRCLGKSLQERKKKYVQSLAFFSDSFKGVGHWTKVRTMKPGGIVTTRAIAYARSIYSQKRIIDTCVADQKKRDVAR
ncbi:MAG: hypothetical protein RI911_767 [Candidatus Parcubacteria bacterium]|jgi:hypothetical protein